MTDKTIYIGGASGYWGDSPEATAQLLTAARLDYLVYDYLAEITMSILARARAKNSAMGYAGDFVDTAIKPNLAAIAARRIKVMSNAGGLNPLGCAAAIEALIEQADVDLTVATVTGDDLIERCEQFSRAGIQEMFKGSTFPDTRAVMSINAYLGALPIVEALAKGADIVITGRVVDSAVTLAACMHEFAWSHDDWDRLAGASLAGHILECGPHATGGNFTDWREVASGIHNIGFPIAEVSEDGSFICSKLENTGGKVSVATVAEQMVYEIGDPQAYVLPDVICDFTNVSLTQLAQDRVLVEGARGTPAPDTFKVCMTYNDGYRGGVVAGFYGEQADEAARTYADAAIKRTETTLAHKDLAALTETSIEVLGVEGHYGSAARVVHAREVAVKVAVKHPESAGVACFLRQVSSLGLASPPGLMGFAATRPKPSPVVRAFSFLLEKGKVPVSLHIDNETIVFPLFVGSYDAPRISRPDAPELPAVAEPGISIPLIELAWGRSGDKGDNVNIGIIARNKEYLPYIWHALSEAVVAEKFSHLIEGPVERYLLPGIHAINYVLHDALAGGGTASLRMDPQGKGFAQLLLGCRVVIPQSVYQK